ncbi:uncharacterized protein NDAI_0H01410 [Naumovozyma dairenensis CBS 421]|uniref:Uncharacterized protein n=1 Tax=Naumovozyma dairenensis (strain ATCC 10597 / BCRC 20456 / CBS 421 / NBRC 0211 / NRRL Y-12639) TaxID=1071378 RepID=G0WEV4_NAUDC|nr:hypothetical protein NDAI_0H01410 [Naumovozyma dairenensis CBS 421]CCD26315.1 hypothetical protein NDAI_0H01410 [Naumovozyma dairenensis CBS 421]
MSKKSKVPSVYSANNEIGPIEDFKAVQGFKQGDSPNCETETLNHHADDRKYRGTNTAPVDFGNDSQSFFNIPINQKSNSNSECTINKPEEIHAQHPYNSTQRLPSFQESFCSLISPRLPIYNPMVTTASSRAISPIRPTINTVPIPIVSMPIQMVPSMTYHTSDAGENLHPSMSRHLMYENPSQNITSPHKYHDNDNKGEYLSKLDPNQDSSCQKEQTQRKEDGPYKLEKPLKNYYDTYYSKYLDHIESRKVKQRKRSLRVDSINSDDTEIGKSIREVGAKTLRPQITSENSCGIRPVRRRGVGQIRKEKE